MRGRNSAPGYHCAGKDIVDGRGQYCLNVGGMVIEQAVANAFLEAVTPAAVEATMLSIEQLKRIQMLGSDIRQVWTAPAITDRDRKELLRTLLEEVILNLKRAEGHAHLTLRWRGGAITVLDVPVPRFRPMGPRTDEDTISLLRRLAALYPDEVIAGILNRQGRKTATGERFTANQVGSLRRYRSIPRFQPPATPPD